MGIELVEQGYALGEFIETKRSVFNIVDESRKGAFIVLVRVEPASCPTLSSRVAICAFLGKIDRRQGGWRLAVFTGLGMRRNGFQPGLRAGEGAFPHQCKQSETAMRNSNQTIRRDPTDIWAHPRNFVTLTILMMIVGLSPLVPRPALSQGVNLVKVDVSVVGKGLRASKLMGRSVVNERNETVGKIDDVIVGDDRSLYAVLEVGGFLGLGSRLVAVPYDNLKIDQENGKVQKVELPGASRDELKRLAEFKYPT